jgi:type VI secretion system secreted protein VgrG
MNIRLQAKRIEITAPEEVVVNGGGSYTQWNASGIQSGTSGSWTAHAGSHSMAGPGNAPVTLQVPPVQDLKETLRLNLFSQASTLQGAALAGEPYELLKDGAVIDQGVTDRWGRIEVKNHAPSTRSYQVRLSNGSVFDLPVNEQLSNAVGQALNQGLRKLQQTPTDPS